MEIDKVRDISFAQKIGDKVVPQQRNNDASSIFLSTKPQEMKFAEKKDEDSKGKTLLYVAGAVALGLLLFGAGRVALNKFKLSKTIPPELKDVFKSVKNEKGLDFTFKTYEKLAQRSGIDRYFPQQFKLNYVKDIARNGCQYNFEKHILNVNEAFRSMPKEKQFMIMHNGIIQCKEALIEQVEKVVPKELISIFRSLKGLKGEEFARAAYPKLVSYMELNGIAPETFILDAYTRAANAGGGYVAATNNIELPLRLFQVPEPNIFGTIAHELKHCEQHANMLRLEGMTVEQYTRAIVESAVNRRGFSGSSEQLEELITKSVNYHKESVGKAVGHILKLPRISPNSTEGQKALSQLESFKHYTGLDGNNTAYRESLLELEAYPWGEKLRDMYRKYLGYGGDMLFA